ncbi:MAG: 5-oxoprolinase subunit PxpB [Chloroflexi bacterium]|nr:5-oxoprolinase subunit PxpB [Chloroflexota bacterium]
MGDRIDLGVNRRVHALAARLREVLAPFGPVEVLPGYVSLLVSYNPVSLSYEELTGMIERAGQIEADAAGPSRRFRLPVVYGGEYGPDLEEVARYHGAAPDRIVEEHAGRDYPIYCLGFSPGFPFLGGLDPALHTPRLDTPRPRVPAGSVGIGGGQTGVYPTATPGGWRLIGRTPLVLFDVARRPPVPYRAGDLIRFEPIGAADYEPLRRAGRMPEGEPIGGAG